VDEVLPADGNTFVVLDSDPQYNGPVDASISQEVEFSAGETIAGQYFFGTYDYVPFSDYATISLIPSPGSGLEEIILVSIDISDVGNYGSTETWLWFTHHFDEFDAGTYTLQGYVTDVKDSILPSLLMLDNIVVCQSVTGGDANHDCRVDLQDFAFLAQYWLNNCEEFEPCRTANFDDSSVIDYVDLLTISHHWLEGTQ
jgi:hypothetical protein